MAVTHTLKPGPASPPPLRAQAGSPSQGHRRTPCSPRLAPAHGETGIPPLFSQASSPSRGDQSTPCSPRPAPAHRDTGIPPVLPGRLPLTGTPAHPLFSQASSPSRGHRRTPCSPRPAPPHGETGVPRSPRPAPPHGETGVPHVLPGQLPLTGRPEYPVLPGRLPLTGRPAYTSLIGIVQPDELLMLSHDGELNLGEVRQAAPEAEKPIRGVSPPLPPASPTLTKLPAHPLLGHPCPTCQVRPKLGLSCS